MSKFHALFLISSLFVATSASAAAPSGQAVRCNVAVDTDFTVEINLKTKKAAFFDNDSWTVTTGYEARELSMEVWPPLVRHIFTARDDADQALEIDFSNTGMEGSVTFEMEGKPVTRKLKGCKAIALTKFWSGL